METTISIPDSLYSAFLARSSAEGQSVGEFLVQAGAKIIANPGRLTPETTTAEPEHEGGWWEAFGSAAEHHEALMEVQRIIDEEFSQIRPEDWE